MEIFHFIELIALVVAFVVVIVLPVGAYLTNRRYRHKLHRAYMTTNREWHPLLPLPAQLHVYRSSYRVIRKGENEQKKIAARKATALPRKSGRK